MLQVTSCIELNYNFTLNGSYLRCDFVANVVNFSVYEWWKSLYKVEVVRRNASKILVSVERKHMIFKQGTYVRTGLFFAVMASQSVMRFYTKSSFILFKQLKQK